MANTAQRAEHPHSRRPPLPSDAPRMLSPLPGGRLRGSYPFRGHKALFFENDLEFAVLDHFAVRRDVVDLIDQPPAVTYVDADGNTRQFAFNYLVVLKDAYKIALVVTTEVDLHASRRNLDCLRAQLPGNFANTLVVMTENDISPAQRHNNGCIRGMMRDRFLNEAVATDADHAALGVVLRMNAPETIHRLVEKIGREGAGFRAVVRMIGDGALELLTPRIDHNAIVRRHQNIG